MIAHLHIEQPVTEFLKNKHIGLLEHTAYSPDLAPSGACLFPFLNDYLRRCRFCTRAALGAVICQWRRMLLSTIFHQTNRFTYEKSVLEKLVIMWISKDIYLFSAFLFSFLKRFYWFKKITGSPKIYLLMTIKIILMQNIFLMQIFL